MLLRLTHITKTFPGAIALDDVDLEVAAGEIHCLVGENGAGKSTLMNILAGVVQSDAGTIEFDGRSCSIASPSDAFSLGIGMIHQDFKLVPEMTAAENILLGREPHSRRTRIIDRGAMRRSAVAILADLGEDIDPDTPVRELGSARRQIIEIAKALSRDVRLLILDEPTAALTDRETENLFVMLRRLRSRGAAIIYISHRLGEIFEIGDRVTVMRDGRRVDTCDVAGVDTAALIRMMVGRELVDVHPKQPVPIGDTLLEVRNVCSAVLRDVSFTLRRGEVLGVAGLIGSGKIELSRLLFGADRMEAGEVLLDGRRFSPASPHDAIADGVALLTEDRNHLGLMQNMTIRENISLSSLDTLLRGPFIDRGAERRTAAGLADQLRLKPRDTGQPVGALSGGNRQKVILARWLATQARLYIFNEPTAGIDVGAKYEIYMLMNRLAGEGLGIICFSSDLPELLGISDRIAVMCDGHIAGILDRESATQEAIMHLATP